MIEPRRFLSAAEVLEQLSSAGLLGYVETYETSDTSLHGQIKLSAMTKFLTQLRKDKRFTEGIFYGLHRDIGKSLTDFRCDRGTFGRGSLQLVVDKVTGNLHADVDKFDIYQDVANIAGHTFVEVVPYLLKSVWRRMRRA